MRALILIDQEPMRGAIAAECKAAMTDLERARARWHHFERKDKPAFARWRACEFGALLSKAREVETQIHDAQALVHEVEKEMRRVFQDPYTAYQRVMARRGDPASPREDTSTGTNGRGPARKVSDFEKEALFQEWVKSSLGTNPDKMDDEAYSVTFEAFKTHMFRNPIEEPGAPRQTRSRPGSPSGPEVDLPVDGPEDDSSPVDARVRELYRRLVRRLHPDLRADGSAAASALWHEVQEAYAATDVARMEILLALSDIEANRTAGQTVAQMQSVLSELERALGALEKSLQEAEREDAWDFARLGANPGLHTRVERQLKTDLGHRTQRLTVLAQMISEWSQGPVTNQKVQLVRMAR